MNEFELILDLLIDFDEMGFIPTTTVPDPEAYAIEWRRKITDLITKFKQKLEKVEADNFLFYQRNELSCNCPHCNHSILFILTENLNAETLWTCPECKKEFKIGEY